MTMTEQYPSYEIPPVDPFDQLELVGADGDYSGFSSSESELERQVQRLRVNEAAREQLAREKADKEYVSVFSDYSFDSLLKEPDQAESYTIDKCFLRDCKSIILGNPKAGKTTVSLDIVRSLADGGKFLGKFQARNLTGNAAYINSEVGVNQLKKWVSDTSIQHPEKVKVLMLRGKGLDLASTRAFEDMRKWIEVHEIESLVIDPWQRFFRGADSNFDVDVNRYLEYIDALMDQCAHLTDLFLVAHTPKNSERFKETPSGSGALERWYDSMIVLRSEQQPDGSYKRYMRAAVGRGEEVPDLLDYREVQQNQNGLWLAGKAAVAPVTSRETSVLNYIRDKNGAPCGHKEMATSLGFSGSTIKKITEALASKNEIQNMSPGPNPLWIISTTASL